jgi:Ca-activated chloride channel family protein
VRVSTLTAAAMVCSAVTLLAQQAVFRSNVDILPVYALVLGPDGRIATDLKPDEFTVREDGAPVQVTSVSVATEPITAGLLLDMSGSMQDRLLGIRDAATALVDALEPKDRLRVGTFGTEVALSPLLTGDKPVLKRILNEELWPGGSTPLWKAMDAGMASLATEAGRRVLILATDGNDTATMTTSKQDVLKHAVDGSFLLFAISWPGHRLNLDLVGMTLITGGGHAEVPDDAHMATSLSAILTELKEQYLLGVVPVAFDGATHQISVTVSRPGYTVRAPTSIAIKK